AAVFDAAGGSTRYAYDGERQQTEVQGPGRRTEGIAWGGFRRIIATTNPVGDVVRYRYTREGALAEVVNELGEIHRLRRDLAGRLVREETFDGRTMGYKRDNTGRVVQSDICGDVTEFVYNEA